MQRSELGKMEESMELKSCLKIEEFCIRLKTKESLEELKENLRRNASRQWLIPYWMMLFLMSMGSGKGTEELKVSSNSVAQTTSEFII